MFWQKERFYKAVVTATLGMTLSAYLPAPSYAAGALSKAAPVKLRTSQLKPITEPVINIPGTPVLQTSGASDTSAALEDLQPANDSGRIIVKYKSGITSSNSDLQKSFSKQISKVTPLENIHAALLQTAEGTDVTSLIDELKKNPDVLYAEPDYKVKLPQVQDDLKPKSAALDNAKYANAPEPVIPKDQFFVDQWSLNNTGQTLHDGDAPAGTPDIDIDAPEAWAVTKGSTDLVVALIDSGVQIDLADLQHQIWQNPHPDPVKGDIHGWDFIHNDASLFDIDDGFGDYHGTQLASLIAASQGKITNHNGITGVAPNVKIMPLKIADKNGFYISDAIRAIEYADQHGAKIANISWAIPVYSQALHEAVEQSSMLFVSAAGDRNERNVDASPVYPAAFNSDNVLSVTAVDRGGYLANGSGYGKSLVDVAAPGDYVVSASPNVKVGYAAEIRKYVPETGYEYKAIYNGIGFENVPIDEYHHNDPKQRQDMFNVAVDYLADDRNGDGKVKVLMMQDNKIDDGGFFPRSSDSVADIYHGLIENYRQNHPNVEYTLKGTDGQSENGPDAAELSSYDVVIWYTGYFRIGEGKSFLTGTDQTNLTEYLNKGGRLLLTGQNSLSNMENTPFVKEMLQLVVAGEGVYDRKVISAANSIYDGKTYTVWDANRELDLILSRDPSTAINLEWPFGYYRYKTGTDMAAANAAGTAALVLSKYPFMEAASVKQRLMNSGKPLSSLAGITASGRMVNAFRAVWDKDIPGTPLQDSFVTDKLNSAARNDLVYAVDMKAGEKVNLSLSGDKGTDFDLILFDPTASTVASSAGIVAYSETPNSSKETVSYQVPKSGTYYVNVHAFAGAGQFQLTVQTDNQWGAFEDTHPALSYDGPWSVQHGSGYSGGSIHTLDAAGSAEFSFKGNQLEWVGTKGSDHGIADVYVDGEKITSLSLYSPKPLTKQSLLKLSMPNGKHTVKVRWTGLHDPAARKTDPTKITIDKWVVSNLTYSTDSLVIYKGAWGVSYGTKFSGGAQRFSNKAEAEAEYTFNGTRVAVQANTGKNLGKANIYIDGVLVTPKAVDWYSPKAKYQVTVYTSPVLKAGSHTVKVVSAGEKQDASTGYGITIDSFNVLE
ncbi:S8 family serine peptidase [Paenibacillus gansuensis]|uniref:S8 family serine peptidase n=1 Tax=Paenibacillus gansuensis TaxID=306542 RepID=A0ABW5PGF9_9BACL